MNKSSRTLLLSSIGAIVFAAGAIYFGAPLFGWLIIVAIFVIYGLTSAKVFGGIRKTVAERERTKRYAELYDSGAGPDGSDLDADGLLNDRVRFLRTLAAKNVPVSVHDLEFLKTAWATREEISTRSNGGVVVLLGLMGTFFGLMLSINAAGSAIDANATSETTLGIIQNIVSNMKGLFGSSLCGIFAALVLNSIYAMYESEHDALIAELDSFTLLYLIPKTGSRDDAAAAEIRNLIAVTKASDDARAADVRTLVESSKAADDIRSKSLAAGLAELQKSLSESFTRIGEKALADLANAQTKAVEGIASAVSAMTAQIEKAESSAVQGLENTGKNASAELRDALSNVTSGLPEEMRKLSTSVQSIESGVVDGLKNEIAHLSSSIADSLSKNLESQMANSGDQWNAFMESLKTSTEQVADAQAKGLETLRAVAESVSSKAAESSVGLSNTVAGEIQKLSQEVQTSFTALAKSSEALVSSQQALIAGIESRVVKENESSEALGSNIAEAAKMMRVNQSEFAANLEMFGKGIEAVLSKLSGDVPEHENEQNFIEQLNGSLENFEERAGEVLIENALKTQEILLEILDQKQKSPSEPKAE